MSSHVPKTILHLDYLQCPEQVAVQSMHHVPLPAVLRDAGQTVRRHPGQTRYFRAGNRGVADTKSSLVGVRVVSLDPDYLRGVVGHQTEPCPDDATVRRGNHRVRLRPADNLPGLLLQRRHRLSLVQR